MALAETPAGQPALELVPPEDDRPIKSDPAHHADRLGPQARDLSLALCRDRPHSRGGGHGYSRIAPRLDSSTSPGFGTLHRDPEAGRRVVEDTIGVSRAGKKCEPVSSIICAVHAGLWQAVTELPDIS